MKQCGFSELLQHFDWRAELKSSARVRRIVVDLRDRANDLNRRRLQLVLCSAVLCQLKIMEALEALGGEPMARDPDRRVSIAPAAPQNSRSFSDSTLGAADDGTPSSRTPATSTRSSGSTTRACFIARTTRRCGRPDRPPPAAPPDLLCMRRPPPSGRPTRAPRRRPPTPCSGSVSPRHPSRIPSRRRRRPAPGARRRKRLRGASASSRRKILYTTYSIIDMALASR